MSSAWRCTSNIFSFAQKKRHKQHSPLVTHRQHILEEFILTHWYVASGHNCYVNTCISSCSHCIVPCNNSAPPQRRGFNFTAIHTRTSRFGPWAWGYMMVSCVRKCWVWNGELIFLFWLRRESASFLCSDIAWVDCARTMKAWGCATTYKNKLDVSGFFHGRGLLTCGSIAVKWARTEGTEGSAVCWIIVLKERHSNTIVLAG